MVASNDGTLRTEGPDREVVAVGVESVFGRTAEVVVVGTEAASLKKNIEYKISICYSLCSLKHGTDFGWGKQMNHY